jgi:hypothetical protein
MESKRFLIIAAAVTLALSSYSPLGGTAAAQDAETMLPMKLYVYNYARVQHPALWQVQTELAKIFRTFRVKTEWLDSSTVPKYPQADSAYSLTIIILGPSGEAVAPGISVLGFSSAIKEGSQPRVAYVIYPRIEHFVRARDAPELQTMRAGLLLAHVIAHEIGHLLLPTTLHSAEGIMRCPWNTHEFKLAVMGHLLFTPEQGDLIRSELAASR